MQIIVVATGACVKVTSRVSSADSAGLDTSASLFVKVSCSIFLLLKFVSPQLYAGYPLLP